MDEQRCIDREKNCNRRFEAVEKNVCAINKPENGALSKMHEKMNIIAKNRPTWTIFWSIILILFSLVFGAYGYVYITTSTLSEKQNNLVTKEDFKEFKKDILLILKDKK